VRIRLCGFLVGAFIAVVGLLRDLRAMPYETVVVSTLGALLCSEAIEGLNTHQTLEDAFARGGAAGLDFPGVVLGYGLQSQGVGDCFGA